MEKCLYDEFVFFEKLRKLKVILSKLSECRLKQSYLASEGISDGYIIYRKSSKSYKSTKGEAKKYNNMSVYLCWDSKKYKVDNKINSYEIVNLQAHLEMLTEIKILYDAYCDVAKFYCSNLNAMRKRGGLQFDFERLLETSYLELKASGEYAKIISELGTDKRDNCGRAINTASELNNTFSNNLFNDRGERFRSKNEIIASFCLSECGIYYNIEPFYPNSNMRADLGLFCCDSDILSNFDRDSFKIREVFVEITGLRGNNQYELRLNQKREIAKHNKIPLLIVDMTDYPDEAGKPQTKFDFMKLSHIFLKVYFGLMPAEGQIVVPY